ncbi:lipopolysaccharide biosynthesis protein [bacterium]|nr:MAG: lipopolysaccharide biosynthesis protein [bacterium]
MTELGMKAKMVRGATWLAASRALVNLIGFVSTLILARLLLPEDFGLVAIASTVIAIVSSVTDIPLSAALVHHENPSRKHFDTAWTLSAIRGALLAAVLGISASPLANFYGDSRLIPLVIAMSAVTFIQSLSNPTTVLFTRDLVFHQIFILDVSKKISGFIVAMLVAWKLNTYWALVVGTATSETVAVFVTYALSPFMPKPSISKINDLLSFSAWLSLTQVVQTINYRLDNLFIGYFLTSGDVGQYSYGDNLATLPTREATAPIAQTLFPAFSRLRDEPERLRAAYLRAQALLCAIALPIGLGFAAIAEPLVRLVLGEKWMPAVLVIQVLSSVLALQNLATSLLPLAMAMGETKTLFKRDMLILVIRLPLILGGLIFGGFTGVVLARLGSGAAATALNMTLVNRLLGISAATQILANKRSLGASATMICTILVVQRELALPESFWDGCAFLAIQVALGAVAYSATSYIAWILESRPSGPETEFAALSSAVFKRVIAPRMRRKQD